MNLYSIDNRILTLLDAICSESEGGELTEEQSAMIDQLAIDRAEKLSAILKYRQTRIARAYALGAESERLRLACAVERDAAERLMRYVKDSMEKYGETKLETDVFRLLIQRNSRPAITITVPVEDLPPQFQVAKTDIYLNRDLVLSTSRSGGDLPDGVLVTTGTHLRII